MKPLVVTTNRSVAFCHTPYPGAETQIVTAPAGLCVHATPMGQMFRIRIVGDELWSQLVSASALTIP